MTFPKSKPPRSLSELRCSLRGPPRQVDVADNIGVTPGVISRLENRPEPAVSDKLIASLARAYGVTQRVIRDALAETRRRAQTR